MLQSVLDAIGNTPLIHLKKASELTGCNIYGKAEFLNPGQSVKDRAALYIIRDAEKRGLLKPGGVIVEGTAGNTGIGLTMVAKRSAIARSSSFPKLRARKEGRPASSGRRTDRSSGGSYRNPNNYVRLSGRLAEQLAKSEPNGAIWANQFDNPVNRQAHIETTAQEIWRETNGKVDGFVAAVGSGGTLVGTAFGLKDHNADIKVALADPYGLRFIPSIQRVN